MLTPEFEAFEDCIDHLKTANNSSYSQGRYLDKRGLTSNRAIGQKDYIKQLLQGGVQCQHMENYKRNSFPEILLNVSLRPCPFCKWEYVPDDYDTTRSVFKLVLKQSHSPDLNKKMLLALTCTPTLCAKEKALDKKCKVTFAIPFIMKNELYANYDNLNIYIVIILMLILLLIFTSSTFYFLRRRKRMRSVKIILLEILYKMKIRSLNRDKNITISNYTLFEIIGIHSELKNFLPISLPIRWQKLNNTNAL